MDLYLPLACGGGHPRDPCLRATAANESQGEGRQRLPRQSWARENPTAKAFSHRAPSSQGPGLPGGCWPRSCSRKEKVKFTKDRTDDLPEVDGAGGAQTPFRSCSPNADPPCPLSLAPRVPVQLSVTGPQATGGMGTQQEGRTVLKQRQHPPTPGHLPACSLPPSLPTPSPGSASRQRPPYGLRCILVSRRPGNWPMVTAAVPGERMQGTSLFFLHCSLAFSTISMCYFHNKKSMPNVLSNTRLSNSNE